MDIDMNDKTGQITQEKLLELLFSQAQHNATREELTETEGRLRNEISETENRLRADINKLDTKLDRMMWFIITIMLTTLGAVFGMVFQFLIP